MAERRKQPLGEEKIEWVEHFAHLLTFISTHVVPYIPMGIGAFVGKLMSLSGHYYLGSIFFIVTTFLGLILDMASHDLEDDFDSDAINELDYDYYDEESNEYGFYD